MTEEMAQGLVEEMVRRDTDTADLVSYMRKQGRPWMKILLCFVKHMERLGIEVPRPGP